MCFLPPSTDDLAHTKKSFSEDLCVPGRSAFLLQTMILLFFVFYVAVAFSCSSFSSGGGGRGIAGAIFFLACPPRVRGRKGFVGGASRIPEGARATLVGGKKSLRSTRAVGLLKQVVPNIVY